MCSYHWHPWLLVQSHSSLHRGIMEAPLICVKIQFNSGIYNYMLQGVYILTCITYQCKQASILVSMGKRIRGKEIHAYTINFCKVRLTSCVDAFLHCCLTVSSSVSNTCTHKHTSAQAHNTLRYMTCTNILILAPKHVNTCM